MWTLSRRLCCYERALQKSGHLSYTFFEKEIDGTDVLSETDGNNGLKRNTSAAMLFSFSQTSEVVTISLLVFALLRFHGSIRAVKIKLEQIFSTKLLL